MAMNLTTHFQDKSYEKHSEHYHEYRCGGTKQAHAKTWFENDTVDAWLHRRMYQILDPILLQDPKATWLTVGDGRYGKDAKYILEKGCDVVASDISDVLLKEAKDIGFIVEYRKENAESLSLADGEFDYVFCKEAYHHFPRPMLALYEMLRVARKAVILIEPNDSYVSNTLPKRSCRNVKNTIKALLGRAKVGRHCFEESGNYVFTISRREVEKVALGLNYKIVAFKGINDSYVPGVEHEKLSNNGPLQKRVRRLTTVANVCCKLGFMDHKLLAAIIFKHEPSEQLLRQLGGNGFEIIPLPDNPYISA
jgi:ubiquinone/menaquinone biosynthesis C-methylase UbiE